MQNTDPTGTNTTATDGVVGTVAGWFSHIIYGTPTAGQLQATSASLDQQLANGTTAQQLADTINGNPPADPYAGTGADSFSGDNSQYAPGGTIYQQIYATQGQAAADAAYAKVQGDIAAQVAQTAAIPGQIGQAAKAGAANGASGLLKWFQDLPGNLAKGFGIEWIIVIALIAFFWLGGAIFIRNYLTKKK